MRIKFDISVHPVQFEEGLTVLGLAHEGQSVECVKDSQAHGRPVFQLSS